MAEVTNEEPGDHDWAPRWKGRPSELEALFGPVGSKPINAELGALDKEPPWQSVRAGDVAALLVAYRQARTLAHDLRRIFTQVGISSEELPELCATIDAQGRPVVMLGTVSTRTAERLGTVLRQHGPQPDPPAHRGRRRAA